MFRSTRRDSKWGRAGTLAGRPASVAALLVILVLTPGIARADEGDDLEAVADTSRFRFSLGARSEVTNESYYEDTFTDTTFLGRRLINTPENQMAGVIAASLTGTRGLRASRYDLEGEASAGDRLDRGWLGLRWKSPLGENTSLHLLPNAEYRHDRTFGRDLEEWRASFSGRARHELGDGLTGAELGVKGDWLSATGRGSEFVLDRRTAGVTAAADHFGLSGAEWRASYTLLTRAFPDSSERDHLEHGFEGHTRWITEGAEASFESTVLRRSTLNAVTTSRDDYWNADADLDARFGAPGRSGWTAGLGGELFRYDVQDSVLCFDYAVGRARAGYRWEGGSRWTVALGPRAEWLRAELNPGENYQEIAAALDAERLGAGSRWSLSPVVGWRDYDRTPAAGPDTPPLHSAYAYYQLDLMADQPLPGRLAVRLMSILRWEQHEDTTQNAGSVYVTAELRWLP